MAGRRRRSEMGSDTREAPSVTTKQIDAHLTRMRGLWLLGEGLILAAAVSCWFLPQRPPTVLGRGWFSLVMAVFALWLGFASNRDARTRMERIRRAFGIHRNVSRLLKAHVIAFAWILLRMIMIAVSAQLISVWGSGPAFSLVLSSLAFLLTLMTFPTEYKTRLLLKRASME